MRWKFFHSLYTGQRKKVTIQPLKLVEEDVNGYLYCKKEQFVPHNLPTLDLEIAFSYLLSTISVQLEHSA